MGWIVWVEHIARPGIFAGAAQRHLMQVGLGKEHRPRRTQSRHGRAFGTQIGQPGPSTGSGRHPLHHIEILDAHAGAMQSTKRMTRRSQRIQGIGPRSGSIPVDPGQRIEPTVDAGGSLGPFEQASHLDLTLPEGINRLAQRWQAGEVRQAHG